MSTPVRYVWASLTINDQGAVMMNGFSEVLNGLMSVVEMFMGGFGG